MKTSVRQIFFDTETTGISVKQGHRILELGAVESIDRELTDNHFHQILNPEREIDEGAMAIHGITYEDVQGKPLFADVVEDFLAYIKGAEVIMHNASFDVKMVNYELSLLSQSQNKDYGTFGDYCTITDSLFLARKMLKSKKCGLDDLCDYFAIDRSDRTHHSAVLDSTLLFHVYIKLTSGQNELFAESEKSKETVGTINEPLSDYRGISLPKVTVLPEELQSHENFMQQLRTSH